MFVSLESHDEYTLTIARLAPSQNAVCPLPVHTIVLSFVRLLSLVTLDDFTVHVGRRGSDEGGGEAGSDYQDK